MYPTAQEEYKLVRNGHPGCTGLKPHGTDRPEGTGVRTGRQEVVVLQAWFSIHSVLYHDFKTCSSVSCALFCQLVAMEKWIEARNFILLCQHFWTYQLPSAPVQTEGSQDGAVLRLCLCRHWCCHVPRGSHRIHSCSD